MYIFVPEGLLPKLVTCCSEPALTRFARLPASWPTGLAAERVKKRNKVVKNEKKEPLILAIGSFDAALVKRKEG